MPIQVQGIHHIVLVCQDIEQTVNFYTTILGFNLTRIHSLSNGGKHHSFAIGILLFVACLLIQLFTMGMSVFVNPSWWTIHTQFSHVIGKNALRR